MKERFVCIHAHFYQPPRENPWLESIEAQPSAYPFHDWNERITAECYAPNGASRIVDDRGRIIEIVNNYSKISFNFGPTLLSWMESQSPAAYRSILEADKLSQKHFSGHGSAMAQAYNHMILPLANRRDKETQILWGIRDFESRFCRAPEGMWLAETAIDLETLEIMAGSGIKFAILAPSQAATIRRITGGQFTDVNGASIDPTRAYHLNLPGGKNMALFFYDGPISRAVAFEKLLNSGEQFSQRLMSGFSDHRDWPQLMNIATDGESYGHHHGHGDMALAFALRHIEETGQAKLTNYGEFLEKHPPEMEVQVIEHTAWSCAHGIERWKSHCGCNSGSKWEQHWRGPLRAAFDWLRDAVGPLFEKKTRGILRDPWAARDAFIDVVLDRSRDSIDDFLMRHAPRQLSPKERITVLKLMEMQRHAMLMYTSCGWFFDEVSGIETMKVIEYAGRVIQLAQSLMEDEDAATLLESGFLAVLAQAKSNVPDHRNGAEIYKRFVKPAIVSLSQVGAHYAISSLFKRDQEQVPTYCYTIEPEDLQTYQSGRTRMALGRARVTSKITLESELLTFGVLHLGDHNVNAGVKRCGKNDGYSALVAEATSAFAKSDLPETLRIFDRHFGAAQYSLKSLLGDQRNNILEQLLESTLQEAGGVYRQIYERHSPLLRFLGSVGMEQPRILRMTAEFVLNASLQGELARQPLDSVRVKLLLEQSRAEQVSLDKAGLGFTLQKSLDGVMEKLSGDPDNWDLMRQAAVAVDLAVSLGLPVNLWRAQNIYYGMAHQYLPQLQNRPHQWLISFLVLAEKLGVLVTQFQIQAQPAQPKKQLQLAR